MSAVDEQTVVNEHEKVTSWRTHVLIEAGYPNDVALEVGARHDVDLHEAVELVEAGCDPVVAAEILL